MQVAVLAVIFLGIDFGVYLFLSSFDKFSSTGQSKVMAFLGFLLIGCTFFLFF